MAADSRAESAPAVDIDELVTGLDLAIDYGIASSLRAIGLGAAVIAGGSLVMTSAIGLSAVTAMLLRGDSVEAVVATLIHSFALVVFSSLGTFVMSLAGGYVAAGAAHYAPLGHAVTAALLAIMVNLTMMPVLGDPGPLWLTMLTTVLVVPFAALGGWLALPARR